MIVPADKRCDICKDKIGLYNPWYTVRAKKFGLINTNHIIRMNQEKVSTINLCPNCFQAYKDFLIEREVQENHKQNYIDIKNP